MRHLPIPETLRPNIEYAYYSSGHMVYANEESLRGLHAKVADFIRRTSQTRTVPAAAPTTPPAAGAGR